MASPSDFVIALGIEFDVPEQELANLTRTLETKLKKSAKIELIDKSNLAEAQKMYKELWRAAEVEAEKYLRAVETGNTKVQRQALRDIQALQAEMNRLYNASSKSSIKRALTTSVKEEIKAFQELVSYHNSLDRQFERSATQQTKLEKQLQKEARETAKAQKEKQAEAERYITSLDRQADKISTLIYYLEKNAQAIDKVEQEYKKGNLTYEQASERLDRLRTSQESLLQRTDRVKTTVEKLNNKFEESGNSSEETRQKYQKLGTELDNLERKAGEATSSFERFDGTISQGKGGFFKQFSTGFKQELGTITAMAAGAKAASMAIDLVVQGLHAAVNEIVEINQKMTDVQMVAGATNEQAMQMFGDYNKLAKDLSVTTKDVISGASEFLRQGRSQADTMDLIKASTIQATLANLSYDESTTLLTSTLNGYKMEAEDAMHIVDALVQVDFKAATSVQELATALQKTANTARTSGVDFERLVGYIGSVSEATRQAPELIGRAFRTMFSRMQGVAAGADIDEAGESLNDVEKVLNSLGIKLRDTNSSFRDMSDVLDDVSSRWDTFTDVQKQQISTAIAGKNQMEIFLALMENYDKALILEQEALNSNGAAMERYAIYQESIAAKMNELKAAFEEFAYSESSQAIIKNFIEIGNAGVRLLNVLSPLFQFLFEGLAGIADVFATGVEKVADFIDWIGGESADEKVDKLNGKISDLESQLEAINENPLNLDADTQQSIIKQLNDELERTKELLAQAQGDKAAEERKSSYDGELNTGEKINLDNYLNYYQDLQSEVERANNKINAISQERVSIEEEYQAKLSYTQNEIDRITEKLQRAKEKGDSSWGVDLYTKGLKDLEKQYQSIFKEYEKQKSSINSLIAQESAHVKSIDENRNSVVNWAKETYKIITALKDEGVQLSEQEEYFLQIVSTMPEILHDFSDFNDKLVENTNNLEDNTEATEQNAQAKDKAKMSASELKSKLELLNDAVNDLDNQQKALNDALQQFQNEGGLSVQTALNLVNANEKFADALVFVDGKIKLNINSLQNLAKQAKITAVEALLAASNMVEGYQSVAQAMIMVTAPGSSGNDPLWEEKYGYGVLNSSVNKGSLEVFKQLQSSIKNILNYSYGSIGNISNFRPSDTGSSSSGSSSSGSSGKDDAQKEYEEALKNKQDLFQTYLKYIVASIDKEIDAIQKEKDTWDKFYDDKINEIKEIEEARDEEIEKEEKLLEIEKLRAELAKANQQVVRIYRRNIGMVA